ncbi:TPA: hypothetical protein HA278_00365 [Candidatus Woesearchaeota archaeon]|nr:hypothetical protein [archaeon]MAG73689.1 hypothetical protein [archaeon]HIJ10482.1 hypothetical protein [Candidatus Woesearchaeota archaeon]
MKQSREPTANVEYHKLFGKIVGAHVIFPNGTVCEYDGSVVQQLQHFELIIDCIHPYNSKARKRIYRR